MIENTVCRHDRRRYHKINQPITFHLLLSILIIISNIPLLFQSQTTIVASAIATPFSSSNKRIYQLNQQQRHRQQQQDDDNNDSNRDGGSMSYVMEPFDTMGYPENNNGTDWFIKKADDGDVSAIRSRISVNSMTIDTEEPLFGKGSLKIEYEHVLVDSSTSSSSSNTDNTTAVVTFGWIQSERPYNCYGAESFAIWYKHQPINPSATTSRRDREVRSSTTSGSTTLEDKSSIVSSSLDDNVDNSAPELHIRVSFYDDTECQILNKVFQSNENDTTTDLSCNTRSTLDQYIIMEESIPLQHTSKDSMTDWTELVVPATNFPELHLNRLRGWMIEVFIIETGFMNQTTTISSNSINGASAQSKMKEGGILWLDQLECRGPGSMFGAVFHARDVATPSSTVTSDNYYYTMEDALHEGTWQDDYFKSNTSREETSVHLQNGIVTWNYTVEQVESWGGFTSLYHLAPGTAYYNLSSMTRFALNYKIIEPVSTPNRLTLRIILQDNSDCNVSCDEIVNADERYYSFYDILASNNTSENELSNMFIASATPSTPFWLTMWSGIIGNSLLDISQIKGVTFELSLNSDNSTGNLVDGVFELYNLRAEQGVDDERPSSLCYMEPSLEFDFFSKSFTQIEYVAGPKCSYACADDPTCLFAASDSFGHCHRASVLVPNDVTIPNGTEYVNIAVGDSCWINDDVRRGAFCEKCTCDPIQKSIDCRYKNLTIIPKTFNETWEPRSLDLRVNPHLVMLGSNQLESIGSYLKDLWLPTSMRFLTKKGLQSINKKTIIHFDDDDDFDYDVYYRDYNTSLDHRNPKQRFTNVIVDPSGVFKDVCCSPGDTVTIGETDFTFCNMQGDQPGIDSVYEDFAYYYGAKVFKLLTPSSPFMAEAAESVSKCAEYCTITAECMYFGFDQRITKAEHECLLLLTNGTKRERVCCDPDHYADTNQTIPGWISGRPPRTRALVDNAVVLIDTPSLSLDHKNDYTASYELSLGSNPTRGAVWIEPKISTSSSMNQQFTISIIPEKVVLYNANMTATVTIRLLNVQKASLDQSTVALQVMNIITACDIAFSMKDEDSNNVYIQVDLPQAKANNTLKIVMVTIGSLAVVLISILLVYMICFEKSDIDDSSWMLSKNDVHFTNPPQIIGRGSFGIVLLAEYRGTQCAVKRTYPLDSDNSSSNGTIASSKKRKSVQSRETPPLTGDYDPSVILDLSEYPCGADAPTNQALTLPTAASNHNDIEGSAHRRHSQSPSLNRTDGDVVQSKVSFDKSSSETAKYKKMKQNFIREMRQMTSLRHPCIATIMGAIFHKSDPYIVMEYMEHGSLYDLVHNGTLILEGEMILNILRDVSQGLRFLHSAEPPLIHGDLKAQNVLVDRRFRAKVTDFILTQGVDIGLQRGSLYWKAPELLRRETRANPKTDIYAFGMVMYEVYSRSEPFDGEAPEIIIPQIMDRRINLRPTIPSTCSAPIQGLILDCLHEDADKRPSSEELDTRLKRLDVRSSSTSHRLSSRSPAVENNAVSLFDIFPAHIAEALSAGRKVEPEYRDVVTIFFSDIVDFTSISASLCPRKVAHLLDRLYSVFDELSHKHDVFKVETIGDAYMAVTNLVKDQSTDHAKRIANFAIDAVMAANSVVIDEDDPGLGNVSIRVGFHSGPVVADVVGNRNPRYCLFGDTVNTANRMESNSRKNRIHCSEYSAEILMAQYPELPIASRGKITVKGKGEMSTYWVNEKGRGLTRSQSKQELYDWIPLLTDTGAGVTDEEHPKAVKSRKLSLFGESGSNHSQSMLIESQAFECHPDDKTKSEQKIPVV